MIDPGQIIELTYPDCNLIDSLPRLQARRLQVHTVRDLIAQPLTPLEYLRRPMLHRSRWLLNAYDLDRQGWRKFYLGSSTEFRRPGLLRVALYRPGETKPSDLVGRSFGPTNRERRVLAKVLAQWCQADLGPLELRVLADDLRLVG